MNPDLLSWTVEGTSVVIKYNGVKVMSLFIGEAMEGAGRDFCVRHIKECDSSPWLEEWQTRRLIEYLKNE